ncbi:MAG: type I restriction-modification system subunit M N-terminal domain-containing protein [Desulfobacula sp.]|uniref:hypothetical protein n=1 Tax=Desulfobacula sp. TaxID=2593537 RepID=UPI0025BC071A|nr:hypothetical protein [Desulfobacula sp.]MCD4718821.1 type I restriction-modification system subunit M N-terminal domain-containing protein [Desulfobacula sp.]
MVKKANLKWEVAHLLRGDDKQSDYGKVILPLTGIKADILALEASSPELGKTVLED